MILQLSRYSPPKLSVGAISNLKKKKNEEKLFSEMRQNGVGLETEQQGTVRAFFLEEVISKVKLQGGTESD